MIQDDPNSTINLELYDAAVQKYRTPTVHEHFAFKIELALGGDLTVDNLGLMDRIHHYKMLSNLARKIKNMPEGTVISSVYLE